LIDFFTEVITRENYQTILYGERNDGLHFGEAGYEILAKLICQKIIEVNAEQRCTLTNIFNGNLSIQKVPIFFS
jgi:lysophospholipase L1-like esterase